MKLFYTKKLLLLLFLLSGTGNIIAQPAIFFTQRDSGCINTVFPFLAIVVSPGDPVVQYTWDFGDGSPLVNTTSPSEVYQYGSSGIFDVKLFVTTQSGDTASHTETGFIKVGTKPTAIIDSVFHDVCFHSAVQFNDLSLPPITGWEWIFGDGSRSFMQNPLHQYIFDTSGTVDPFDIVLIAYDNGCSDTDTVANMVSVRGPIPDFMYGYDCDLPFTVSFTNLSGGADNYTWDFGDGSPADTSMNVVHVFDSAGTYLVKLTATNISNNCTVDTTYIIDVSDTLSAVIHEEGPNLICEPHGSQYFYEWYFNGSPLGTCTTDTCDAQQSGVYYVIVTDFISNCSDTAEFYNFNVNTTDLDDENMIFIYPNPVGNELLSLDLGNSIKGFVTINLFDTYGRLFIHEVVNTTNSSGLKQFDISTYESGVYFLRIETGNKSIVRKIIKS